jgi:hypothetical protein
MMCSSLSLAFSPFLIRAYAKDYHYHSKVAVLSIIVFANLVVLCRLSWAGLRHYSKILGRYKDH